MIFDLVLDTWDDDIVQDVLGQMGQGRLVMNPEQPDTPYEDADGYLVVRVKGVESADGFARELQRRVLGLRIVDVVNRSPGS